MPFNFTIVEVSRLPGATGAIGTLLVELRLSLMSFEANCTVDYADFFLLNLTLNKLNKQSIKQKTSITIAFSTIDFVDYAYLDCLECLTRTRKYVCATLPVRVRRLRYHYRPPSLNLVTISHSPDLCVAILL